MSCVPQCCSTLPSCLIRVQAHRSGMLRSMYTQVQSHTDLCMYIYMYVCIYIYIYRSTYLSIYVLYVFRLICYLSISTNHVDKPLLHLRHLAICFAMQAASGPIQTSCPRQLARQQGFDGPWRKVCAATDTEKMRLSPRCKQSLWNAL